MMHVPGESGPSPGSGKTGAVAERSFGRAANWTVGAAAALLVLISMGGYFYHREKLSAIAADHMRLVVTGPSVVRSGVTAEYMVSVTSIGGQPLPADVEAEITSSNGKRLQAHQEPVDDRGRLQVVVPSNIALPPKIGLKVVARHGGSAVDAELPIRVEPVLDRAQLATDRRWYRPGDTVLYRAVVLDRFTLAADSKRLVRFEIVAPDGSAVSGSKHTATTERGVADGRFVLPSTLPSGRYALVVDSAESLFPKERRPFVVVAQPPNSTLPVDAAKQHPSGDIEVEFYPEGGELVAGLENRVYFIARDSSGRPTSMLGKIVVVHGDRSGQDIEAFAVETMGDGLGVFSILPSADEVYRLRISNPQPQKYEPALPKVSTARHIVLSTGSGFFAARRPLEFVIRAADAGRPLVAAAYCRGVQVGQQPVVTKVGASRSHPVAIDVDDGVAGVIRLAVFDYGTSPPTLAAERLIYRRPMQKLNVRIDGRNAGHRPGDTATMSLWATDENHRPAAAVLGVAVVESIVAGRPIRSGASLPVYFFLTSEVALPKGFHAADFDVLGRNQDVGSSAGLDWLLGVQLPSAALVPAPLMFDNLAQIRLDYEKGLTEYQAERVAALDTLTTIGFFGGLGLVLLVAMLGLMRIVSGMHLWIAAIGATTCCLIIGAILTDPGRLAMERDAMVSFSSFCELQKSSEAPRSAAAANDWVLPDVEDVPQTVYWNPRLSTGADGKAEVQFVLPGAPAKLEVDVEGFGEGRLGDGRAEVVSDSKHVSGKGGEK